GARRGTGQWVVDGRRRGKEIAGAHCGRWNRAESLRRLAIECPLIASKEEKAVSLDWSAERAARLFLERVRFRLPCGTEVRLRLEPLVVVILEQRAAELIGAAFDQHVCRHAA